MDFDVAAPADHVLRAAEFQQSRPGFVVAAAHRIRHLRDRECRKTAADSGSTLI